jgi:CRP/FNR family transcriptional regulator
MKEMDKNTFLKGISIFKTFSKDEIETLSKLFIEEHYDKDKYIYYEGESNNGLYIVYQGRVKIIKQSFSGRDVIVNIFQPGDIFGIIALLLEGPFPVSAIACEPSIILKMPKSQFINLDKRFSGLTLSIAKTMGMWLLRAHDIMQTMAVEKVEVRIARVLLMLFEEQIPKEKDPISVTRQELADMVGTTVETSIRTISKFKRKGLLTSRRGKIWIKNISALEMITNGEKV